MSKPKQSQRFAEIEYCLQHYFDAQLAPVMRNVQKELFQKQAKEYRDYATSFNGIMQSMAGGMHHVPCDNMQYLRLTGEWNSKTTEDYVDMCKEQIGGSKAINQDLCNMSGEWRNTLIEEIGRDRYDQLSEQLGSDLAYAYVDYRVEQMMVDQMVADQIPKSSMEYILRKGMSESLLGLSQSLSKSPLQQHIEERGEAAYNPSMTEKGAGKVLSFGTDIVTTGGFSSWGAVAKLAGAEVVFSGIEHYLDKKPASNPLTIEQCISKGVFGTAQNVFTDFRKESRKIVPYENEYVLSCNRQLINKMEIPTKKPFWADDFKPVMWQPDNGFQPDSDQQARYDNIPLVVAPGQEEAFLAEQKRMKDEREADSKTAYNEETRITDKKQVSSKSNTDTQEKPQNNENGWSGLLSSVGLNGMGDIGKNLGYVISMLPDVLVGLFTGKTKSLNLKDNIMPIASILVGMFIRNPILKMVLIGMGGLNLFNKIGHEAIEDKEGIVQSAERYKVYPDEAINPRIDNPTLQGNSLIATIDKVPCSIQLPETVIAAYRAGALPLNTLANAILAKNDRMYHVVQDNYHAVENEQSESRERTVGIK